MSRVTVDLETLTEANRFVDPSNNFLKSSKSDPTNPSHWAITTDGIIPPPRDNQPPRLLQSTVKARQRNILWIAGMSLVKTDKITLSKLPTLIDDEAPDGIDILGRPFCYMVMDLSRHSIIRPVLVYWPRTPWFMPLASFAYRINAIERNRKHTRPFEEDSWKIRRQSLKSVTITHESFEAREAMLRPIGYPPNYMLRSLTVDSWNRKIARQGTSGTWGHPLILEPTIGFGIPRPSRPREKPVPVTPKEKPAPTPVVEFVVTMDLAAHGPPSPVQSDSDSEATVITGHPDALDVSEMVEEETGHSSADDRQAPVQSHLSPKQQVPTDSSSDSSSSDSASEDIPLLGDTAPIEPSIDVEAPALGATAMEDDQEPQVTDSIPDYMPPNPDFSANFPPGVHFEPLVVPDKSGAFATTAAALYATYKIVTEAAMCQHAQLSNDEHEMANQLQNKDAEIRALKQEVIRLTPLPVHSDTIGTQHSSECTDCQKLVNKNTLLKDTMRCMQQELDDAKDARDAAVIAQTTKIQKMEAQLKAFRDSLLD